MPEQPTCLLYHPFLIDSFAFIPQDMMKVWPFYTWIERLISSLHKSIFFIAGEHSILCYFFCVIYVTLTWDCATNLLSIFICLLCAVEYFWDVGLLICFQCCLLPSRVRLLFIFHRYNKFSNLIEIILESFLEHQENEASEIVHIVYFGSPVTLLGLAYLLNYRLVMHLYECLQSLKLLWSIRLH